MPFGTSGTTGELQDKLWDVTSRRNNKLNGKSWVPSAEVVQRNAKTGTVLVPAGNQIHVDALGKPDLTATNPSPLFNQGPPTKGEWTNSLIHIHPIGVKGLNGNTFIPETYTWTNQNGTPGHLGQTGGPSLTDQNISKNSGSYDTKIRSVVVDRNFIYLYFYDRIMMIKRNRPDKKYQ